ncbi:hypothetical protein [Sphingomonas sp. VNH70]|uniref:hypothetical protein n=1 Tax=Sphingomonas silueang TaxID=3156617 RepID=UPI0032B4C9E1
MTTCSDEAIETLLAAARGGTGEELALVDRLLAEFPDDARLHFLRGSFLAGGGRAIEAHGSLSRAVALAPDFALARFQLGFFELTSGEAGRALATWQPLTALPEAHYLAQFVGGLTHLIHDRFAEAQAALAAGIAANGENPPLNRDMQLIIDECRKIAAPDPAPVEAASATSFLLGQIGGGGMGRG